MIFIDTVHGKLYAVQKKIFFVFCLESFLLVVPLGIQAFFALALFYFKFFIIKARASGDAFLRPPIPIPTFTSVAIVY